MSLLYRISRIIWGNGVCKEEGKQSQLIVVICPHSVATLGIQIKAHYYTFPFSSELAKLLPLTEKRKTLISLSPASRLQLILVYIKLVFDDVLHFQSILETFN